MILKVLIACVLLCFLYAADPATDEWDEFVTVDLSSTPTPSPESSNLSVPASSNASGPLGNIPVQWYNPNAVHIVSNYCDRSTSSSSTAAEASSDQFPYPALFDAIDQFDLVAFISLLPDGSNSITDKNKVTSKLIYKCESIIGGEIDVSLCLPSIDAHITYYIAHCEALMRAEKVLETNKENLVVVISMLKLLSDKCC